MVPDRNADNSEHYQVLTEELVYRAGRTGGTILHASRTRPNVNVKEHYNTERLRPHYKSFEMKPLFIMTS